MTTYSNEPNDLKPDISVGASNPRLFFRSMIENFNSDLSEFGDESAEFEFSIDRVSTEEFLPNFDGSIENISAASTTGFRPQKYKRRARNARHGITKENAGSNGPIEIDNDESESVDDVVTKDIDDDTPSLSLPESFDVSGGFPIPRTILGQMQMPPDSSNGAALHILDRIKQINVVKEQREQTLQYLRSFKDLEGKLRGEIASLKALVDDRNFTFQNLVKLDIIFDCIV